MGQQIRRGRITRLVDAALKFGYTEGLFVKREGIDHVIAGKLLLFELTERHRLWNKLELVAAVAPEVGGVGVQGVMAYSASQKTTGQRSFSQRSREALRTRSVGWLSHPKGTLASRSRMKTVVGGVSVI